MTNPDTAVAVPALDEPRSRWLLVIALGTVFVALAMFVSSGALIDDAYIAIRYSQRLAQGEGLTFQDGPRVEGYTCFSWVLLGAWFEWVGFSSAALLPLVGIACGAATVVVATRAAQRWASPGGSMWAGLPSGLLLACSPGLASYAGSGLETAPFVLLVLLALVASLDGRAATTGVAAALALLTRPEGAVAAALTLSLGWLRALPHERRAWYQSGAGVALVAAAFAVFKWSYFGALLPNTAVAKAPVLSQGLRYVGEQLIDVSLLLLITIVIVAPRARRWPRYAWCLVAAALLALVAVAEGGDWMGGNRLLLPALAAAAPALDALRVALTEAPRKGRVALATALVPALGLYGYGAHFDADMFASVAARTAGYEPPRDDLTRQLVDSGVRSVGTLDIGRMSYAAPSLRFLDLGGLTDAEVARLPGSYHGKRLPEALLEAKAPDAFVFAARRVDVSPPGPPRIDFHYAVEASVARTKWFGERYHLHATRPASENYVLCWFARRTSARP